IGFAVVAYCRTILHSNVRQRLTDHVQIPPALLLIHAKVRASRNATVAHPQSELAVTYTYAALDGPSLAPRYVGSMTVTNPLPETVVDEFRELVAALQDLLDEAIDPVRERLMLDLMDVDRAAMVAKGEKPNILGK